MEILNTTLGNILIVMLIIINIISFIVMARDKKKAINNDNTNRIPEGVIFFIAAIFGGMGIYLGMFVLRHKNRKWYFRLGIPLLILQNIATIYLALSI
jgi:uncharacterized membrane protein YsdA (DUF1294 family)